MISHLFSSIKHKLTLIVMGVATLMSCITAGLFTYSGIQQIEHRLVEEHQAVLRALSQDFVNIIAFDNSETLINTVAQLADFGDIHSLVLSNKNSQVLLRYKKNNSTESFPETDFITFTEDVVYQDINHGNVKLQLSRQRLSLAFQQYLEDAGILLLIILVISFFISRLAQEKFNKPIIELSSLASTIAENKNYHQRLYYQGNDEVANLYKNFNDLLATVDHHQKELAYQHVVLEKTVKQRTRKLEQINNELESFSYSVSHDLRSPLRSLDGFSLALLEDCSDQLDATGTDYLQRIRKAAQRMSSLIDDLLRLSRITRQNLNLETVNLSELSTEILSDLHDANQSRNVDYHVENNMMVKADKQLLRVLMENLLGNAWKYTAKRKKAYIRVKSRRINNETTFYIQDNGTGFDMTYVDKLFGAFQRLHVDDDFNGTGIGLATAKRIVTQHEGEIWGAGELDKGATFSFILGGYEKK